MLTEQELPTTFPAVHGRYKLLKHLGGGWTSDVYLAELAIEPEDSAAAVFLPKQFALKLAVDKTIHYPDILTVERIEAIMLAEHAGSKDLVHPCLVKSYSGAVPEERKHIEILSEAGCCNIRQLQGAMTDPSEDWNNSLPMPVIKYLAAQLVLGMEYLHAKKVYWGDPTPQNVVVMSDFTIRIIDIVAEWAPELVVENDARMLAAALYNMASGDTEVAHKPKDWLLSRFQGHRAKAPLFYEMLSGLLDSQSLANIWNARFWKSDEGESRSLDVDGLTDDQKLEEVIKMKRAAWDSLSLCGRAFLVAGGVNID